MLSGRPLLVLGRGRPLLVSRRPLLAAIVTLALIAPAADAVEVPTAPLEAGRGDGATIARDGRKLRVALPPRSYRLIAGRTVALDCTDLPARGGFATVTESYAVITSVPRRRRPIVIHLIPPERVDVCEISRPRTVVGRRGARRRFSQRKLATVPLTERGIVDLDERARARLLFAVITQAGILGDRRDPPALPAPAALVARLGGDLVALDSPEATPPPGRLGYWSDGARHGAVVILSRAGRRLYIEVDEDERLASNVLEYLF